MDRLALSAGVATISLARPLRIQQAIQGGITIRLRDIPGTITSNPRNGGRNWHRLAGKMTAKGDVAASDWNAMHVIVTWPESCEYQSAVQVQIEGCLAHYANLTFFPQDAVSPVIIEVGYRFTAEFGASIIEHVSSKSTLPSVFGLTRRGKTSPPWCTLRDKTGIG